MDTKLFDKAKIAVSISGTIESNYDNMLRSLLSVSFNPYNLTVKDTDGKIDSVKTEQKTRVAYFWYTERFNQIASMDITSNSIIIASVKPCYDTDGKYIGKWDGSINGDNYESGLIVHDASKLSPVLNDDGTPKIDSDGKEVKELTVIAKDVITPIRSAAWQVFTAVLDIVYPGKVTTKAERVTVKEVTLKLESERAASAALQSTIAELMARLALLENKA